MAKRKALVFDRELTAGNVDAPLPFGAGLRSILPIATQGTGGDDHLVGTDGADHLEGLGGNDLLEGLGGDDLLDGGAGDDEVHGGEGEDTIFEVVGGNDEMYGEGGNDSLSYRSGSGAVTAVLDGDTGDDVLDARFARDDTITLNGGSGSDRIFVGLGLNVSVDAGDDADFVQISNVFAQEITLGAGADLVVFDDLFWEQGGIDIKDFIAGDSGDAINLVGLFLGAFPSAWTNPFGSGAMTLHQFGADVVVEIDTDAISSAATVQIVLRNVQASSLTAHNLGFAPDGSAGSPLSLSGSAGIDFLTGHSANDTIVGNGGDDLLFGAAGNDYLTGGDGADELYGQFGDDTLEGGAGDDFYFISLGADLVVETIGGGNDRIVTITDFTLSANSEVETIEASGFNFVDDNDNVIGPVLTGNEFAQTIIGSEGQDILRGEGGNDSLFGHGDDDFLIGGSGADIMVGGLGDDTYYFDDLGDVLSEFAGQGNDRIAAIISLALAADADIERIEAVNLTSTEAMDLTGSAIANIIYGNDGQNILRGEAGNDELRGFGGNDFLVGGPGTDLMVGGLGDDTFYVDDASDAIGEVSGEGNDRIAASVSFVLSNGANVELLEAVNLTATTAFDLTGSDSANTITGNDGVNILRGEGGNDILSAAGGDDFLVGGTGVDSMTGGAGNDTYYVDDAGDQIFEIAGQGNDRVAASVSYALAADAHVEQLEAATLTATDPLNLTGSNLANVLYGNDGANLLDGKGGGDALYGFGGADSYAFTTALEGANFDTVIGFVSGSDRILIDNAIFTGLAEGALSADAFRVGSAAQDGDDRILYNSQTGQLYFDADGNGAGAAILFATLSGAPALAASDFTVI